MASKLEPASPSWDDLRHLEALARLGSPQAVARELSVAPSTVYRRIRALEAACGFSCWTQEGGVQSGAQPLVALARSTRDALTRVVAEQRAREQAVCGEVTITTLDAFAPLLVAPLCTLALSQPNLRVQLHVSERSLSLRRREADVALSVAVAPPAHLFGRRVFQLRFGVYGLPALIRDAARARWVTLGRPHHKTPEALWERQHVPAPAIAVSTASRRTFVDLVVAGAGIGLLPRQLAELHPELVELESQRRSLRRLSRPAWVLVHPAARDEPRIAVTLKVLAEGLRSATPTRD